MRVYLTAREASAVVEALRWAVFHVRESSYHDAGKPARIVEAEEVHRAVRAKVSKSSKEVKHV